MQHFVTDITDIIQLENLERILDSYTKATGMITLITDLHGNPLTTYTRFSPICKKIRENPKLCARCVKCDALGGLEASLINAPYIYECHAGLTEVCVPIVVNGKAIATLFTGQIRLKKSDLSSIVPFVGEKTDIFSDPNLTSAYDDYLKKTKILSYKEVMAYSTLIGEMANYIAKLGYEKILRTTVQEQATELLEKSNIKLKSQLLVNQYNSNFLYEAFNTLYNLSLLEGATDTSNYLYSFASIFKRSLSNTNIQNTLEKELIELHKLMDLYNISYNFTVHLVGKINPLFKQELVPITLLQPLLENVFLDLIARQGESTTIVLDVSHTTNFLKLTLSCDALTFPKINYTHRKEIYEHELFFSKINLFALTIIQNDLERFYHHNFKLYSENNSFCVELPSLTPQ